MARPDFSAELAALEKKKKPAVQKPAAQKTVAAGATLDFSKELAAMQPASAKPKSATQKPAPTPKTSASATPSTSFSTMAALIAGFDPLATAKRGGMPDMRNASSAEVLPKAAGIKPVKPLNAPPPKPKPIIPTPAPLSPMEANRKGAFGGNPPESGMVRDPDTGMWYRPQDRYNNAPALEVAQRIGKADQADRSFHVSGNAEANPYVRSAKRGWEQGNANIGAAEENPARIAASRRNMENFPVSKEQRIFNEEAGVDPIKSVQLQGLGATIRGFVQGGIEQAAQFAHQLPMTVGFNAFGPAGNVVGAGGGSYLQSGGAKLIEYMIKEGVDVTDDKQIKAKLSDPAFRAKYLPKAKRYASGVGLVDGLSAGVGGQVLGRVVRSNPTLWKLITTALGELGGQAGMDAASEVAGQVAETSDVDAKGRVTKLGKVYSPADVRAEALYGLPANAVEVTQGALQASGGARITKGARVRTADGKTGTVQTANSQTVAIKGDDGKIYRRPAATVEALREEGARLAAELREKMSPAKNVENVAAESPAAAVTVPTMEIPKVSTTPTKAGPSAPAIFREVEPEEIGVEPGLQYKKEGITDFENAVTNELKGTNVYDVDQGGILTVWERLDGSLKAVNGHHRAELAKRAGRFVSMTPDGIKDVARKVRVRVLREADGWTMEMARGQGALENIRDGKGSAVDALSVIRDLGIQPETFNEYGMSMTSTLARNVSDMSNLPDNALARVQNGEIDESVAAGIGNVNGLTPQAVMGAMDEAKRGGISKYADARRLAQLFKEEQDAGRLTNNDGNDLFGGDFAAATISLVERVKIEEAVKKALRGEFAKLMEPVGAELRPGESIDVEGRKADAKRYGSKPKEVVTRVDLVLRNTPEIKQRIAALAAEVANGQTTIDKATKQLLPIIRGNLQGATRNAWGVVESSDGRQGSAAGSDTVRNEPTELPRGGQGRAEGIPGIGKAERLTLSSLREKVKSAFPRVTDEQIDAMEAVLRARAAVLKVDVDTLVGDSIQDVRAGTPKQVKKYTGNKAMVQVNDDGSAIITALSNPDISSIMHELAHVFFYNLTPAEQAAMRRAYGIGGNVAPTDAQIERFARNFERYLRDGVAPSPTLKGVFAKFKVWMTEIYRTLRGSAIAEKLTPDVRGFFDSLLTPSSKVETTRGHEDNESAQAARRLLEKRGIDWREDATPTLRAEGAAIRELFQERVRAAAFYSQLRNTVEQKVQGRVNKTSLLAMLKNNGVKDEEIQWMGLETLFNNKAVVNRDELLSWLDGNAVQIEETTYGVDAAGRNTVDQPRYGAYQMPGGDRYRELLFTLPKSKTGENYRSSHWSPLNVLAHVRFNERTDAEGRKVLHIEEVQSDWHQDGRKKGYAGENREEINHIQNELQRLTDERNSTSYDTNGAEGLRKLSEINRRIAELNDRRMTLEIEDRHGVPDAPFKKTWHEFVMKRMLRWAVENNFDRITWTTGEAQAARYNLSKQISRIEYEMYEDGLYEVQAYDKDGTVIYNEEDLTAHDLEGVIGQELAQKIINDEGSAEESINRSKYREWKAITGVDIRTGGEGMIGFYDRILPQFMQKYVKKWGARVESARVDTTTDNGSLDYKDAQNGGYEIFDVFTGRTIDFVTTEGAAQDYVKRGASTAPAHAVNITEAMRDAVLYEGQPLFQAASDSAEGRRNTDTPAFRRGTWDASDPRILFQESEFQRRITAFGQKIHDDMGPDSYAEWEALLTEFLGKDIISAVADELPEVYEQVSSRKRTDLATTTEGRLRPAGERETLLAGNINLDRLAIRDDQKQFLIDYTMQPEVQAKAKEMTRGKQTWDDSAKAAEEVTLDLVNAKAGRAYNAEEVMVIRAALAVALDDLAAAQQAYDAVDSTENKAALEDAMAQYQAVYYTARGAAAEAGRALSVHRRMAAAEKLGKTQLQRALEDLSETEGDRTKVYGKIAAAKNPAEVAKIVGDAVPKSEHWLHAFLSNNMLSSPVGRVRDMVYSRQQLATRRMVTNRLQRWYRNALQKARGVAPAIDQLPADVEDKLRAMGEKADGGRGWKEFANVMRDGMTSDQAEKLNVPTEVPIRGALEKMGVSTKYADLAHTIYNYGIRSSGAVDWITRAPAESGEILVQAGRQAMREGVTGEAFWQRVTEITDEVNAYRAGNGEALAGDYVQSIVEAAEAYGDLITFTEESDATRAVTGVINKTSIQTKYGAIRPLKLIIPFRRFGLNWLKQAWHHSPAGLFRLLHSDVKGIGNEEAQGRVLAEATVGTGMMLGIAGLIAAGLLQMTGAYPDKEDDRRRWQTEKTMAYAMRVRMPNGKYSPWMSYKYLSFGQLFATAQAAMQYMSDLKTTPEDAQVARLLTATGKLLFDYGAMTGVASFFRGMTDASQVDKMLSGIVAQASPFSSARRLAVNIGDNKLRRPDAKKGAILPNTERFVADFFPEYKRRMPAELDAFGEEITRPESTGWNALNPYPIVQGGSNNPVIRELIAENALPGTVGRSMRRWGQDIRLTKAQHQDLQRFVGNAISAELAKQIATPAYQDTPDKQAYLKRVTERVKDRYREAWVRENAEQLIKQGKP